MPVSFAAPGTHTVYVFYIDSAGVVGGTQGGMNANIQNLVTVTVTVGGGGGGGGIEGTDVSLTQVTNPAVAGQPVAFLATVLPKGASGKVGLSLNSGQTFVDSATLDANGQATLTDVFNTPGTYSVYVYYFDDLGNIGAKNFITVTVN
jgi:hypothetical protein